MSEIEEAIVACIRVYRSVSGQEARRLVCNPSILMLIQKQFSEVAEPMPYADLEIVLDRRLGVGVFYVDSGGGK